MKVVIQCAAQKQAHAGHMRLDDGRRVMFVAHPSEMAPQPGVVFAHPDDETSHDPHDSTWRERLTAYNQRAADNPFGLLPAYRLYRNPAYEALVDRLGADAVYILSAGWGLLPASFLTPNYDITFSGSAPSAKRRRRKDPFADLSLIPGEPEDPIIFFGGADYRPLFQTLTTHCRAPRVVVYNSATLPDREGLRVVRYHTTARTNWHYQAVKDFLRGEFDPIGASER